MLITACASPSPSPTSEPVVQFASYPALVIGVVIDPDGNVLYVEPGSAAQQAGITPGDLLQKINNLSVSSERQQIHTAIGETMPGQALIVELKRSGNYLVLSVKPTPPTSHAGVATATPVAAPNDYL